MTQWIGYLAAILTTACYIPQALHVLRERKTEGISLFAYSVLFCGVASWLMYGILMSDWPIILANGCTLPFLVFIIVMKLRLK
jgi:MtN3 and saliva related transmembrane protein